MSEDGKKPFLGLAPRSLRWQFRLALLLLVSLIAATSLLSISSLHQSVTGTNQLAGDRLAQMDAAQELGKSAILVELETHHLLADASEERMQASYARIIPLLDRLDQLTDQLGNINDDIAVLAMHQAEQIFRNIIHVVVGLRTTELRGGAPTDGGKIRQRFSDELQRQALEMVAAATKLSTHSRDDYQTAVRSLAAEAEKSKRLVFVVFVASLIAACLFFFFVLERRVLTRLHTVSRYLLRNETENISILIPIHGADEISAMARSVEQFIEDRRQLARVNQALQQTNDMLHGILDAAPTAIIDMDLDGNVRSIWNASAEKMLGWKADDVMGRPLPTLQVENGEEFKKVREQIRDGASLNGLEVQRRRRDGSPIDYSIYASPLRSPEGDIIGNISVLVDISERKRLEEERSFQERVNDILSRLYRQLISSDADIRDVSATLLEAVRNLLDTEEGLCSTIDSETGRLVNHALTDMFGECCQVRDKPNPPRSIESNSDANQGLPGHALRAKKAFFTNNPEVHPSSHGTPEGQAPLRNLLIVPIFFGEKQAGIIALANKKSAFNERDLKTIEEVGRYYTVAIQRVEALEKLRKSEERHRTLVELMQEGIVMVGADDRISFVNHQLCRMLGRSQRDLLGYKLKEFVAPEHQELYQRQMTLRRQGHAERYELTLLHADNGRVFSLVSPTTLCDERSLFVGAFSVVTNITMLKLLENQLMQAQKLKAIGQLAAGIAHEINTPTQYVDNNVRYLEDGYKSLLEIVESCRESLISEEAGGKAAAFETLLEEKGYDALKEELPGAVADALEGLSRIAEIVRSVKQLAHPGKAEMELTDINEAVKSTVIVSRNEWKYVADLETDFDKELPLTPCHRGEFTQVILNLIVNAVHAIQEKLGPSPERKGRIRVTTKKVENSVEIRVEDSGAGISEAIRSKVFDPFFTTKEVGKGTGQGLAISHSIIREKHGGQIFFETEEGRGTTFIVRLPLELEQ